MQKLKPMSFAVLLLAGAFGYTQVDPNWKAVTSKAHRVCDAEQPCRILQSNGSFEVKFVVSAKEGLQTLENVRIRNLKNGKVQDFVIDAVSDIPESDYFQLFQVQLRPGHERDLALLAFLSAREGEVFYYFVYDSKANKYVMSEDTFPRLKYKKGAQYTSDLQERLFELGKDLEFRAVE